MERWLKIRLKKFHYQGSLILNGLDFKSSSPYPILFTPYCKWMNAVLLSENCLNWIYCFNFIAFQGINCVPFPSTTKIHCFKLKQKKTIFFVQPHAVLHIGSVSRCIYFFFLLFTSLTVAISTIRLVKRKQKKEKFAKKWWCQWVQAAFKCKWFNFKAF